MIIIDKRHCLISEDIDCAELLGNVDNKHWRENKRGESHVHIRHFQFLSSSSSHMN